MYRHDYLVNRSLAYQYDQYCNNRHSGAIGLLIVYSSIVLVYSRFRRQIGIKSYLSSNNSSFIGCRLISKTIIRIAGVLVQ